MGQTVRLGVVGVGRNRRGLKHLELINSIGARPYPYTEREDGHPGNIYLRHAQEVPDWVEADLVGTRLRVTAVCDPDPAARQLALEKSRQTGPEPELFETFEQFLDSEAYDAALLCTPNDVHVDGVIPLMEKGVDTLCEKPLATTLEDHDRIIAAAENSDALFYPGFNMRMRPLFRLIKGLVEDGSIGRLGAVSCAEVRGPFQYGYRYSRERSGGSLLEKNCHDFDIFCWFAEADPVRVAAFGNIHLFRRDNDALDQATVNVEFENGVLGALDLCLYAPFGQRGRTYDLRGSEGLLRTPEQEGTIDLYRPDGRDSYRPDTSGGHGGGDYRQLLRFIRCLQGSAEPPATPGDGKRAAAIAIAAQESIESGRVVEIDEDYNILA